MGVTNGKILPVCGLYASITHPRITPRSSVIPTNRHHPHVLQDYLEALAEAASATSPQDQKLLFGYAEMKYRMVGGSKCPQCTAHVRLVVPVYIRRPDGQQFTYDCLCQRCLLGEIGLAEEVELRIGEACVRYTRDAAKKEPATRNFVSPFKAKAADSAN